MTARRYVKENGFAAMLVIKRLAGVILEVNLGECITVNKAAHSDTESQRRHHQKS